MRYTELVGVQEMNIETEATLRAELVLQENELLQEFKDSKPIEII